MLPTTEYVGEDEEECTCDPCTCETPEHVSPVQSKMIYGEDEEEEEEIPSTGKQPGGYQLDEFVRAKEYFLQASTQSGLTLYDHLSEVIRKLLDTRSPPNAVDFLEEISMNVKRYRFGVKKDLLHDKLHIPPDMLQDSRAMVQSWKHHAQWSAENAESHCEDRSFGGFPNFMRLLYYLEQINVGLPHEEMFRIALSVRQLTVTKPVIIRARFWGKIMGLYKSYYIVEAELRGEDSGPNWIPPSDEQEETLHPEDHVPAYASLQTQHIDEGQDVIVVPGAAATFERAGFSVTDPEILAPYQETSGLPHGENSVVVPNQINAFENEYYGEGIPEAYFDNAEAASELERWHQYQHELMTGFPVPRTTALEEVEVQPEPKGVGLNRHAFYATSDLGKEWILLPDVTPKHINSARKMRWFLTGNLDGKIKTLPAFPGREGHYLRAQLARITAGAMVSPRGYYRTRKLEYDDEDEEEEDIEEEDEEERIGDDTVYPMRKYKPPPMLRLLNPTMEAWVHHTNYILRQGRVLWWNPTQKKRESGEGGEDDEDLEDEEEEEESRDKEFGPALFKSLTEDKSLDGISPWSTRASSSVFSEFQVVCARSNLWPGSSAMCTIKGKVENIYIGDGLKFAGSTYAPFVPEETGSEYKEGPELKEDFDPTAEFEQSWIKKVELKEIADIEPPFIDNEDESDEGEDTELEDYTATDDD